MGSTRPNYFSPKSAARKADKYALADFGVTAGDADANLELLENLPGKNIAAKAKLLRSYEAQFGSWAFELQEGFNLLMYGFGSKKELLEQFAVDALTDGGVLAVHGLRKGATPRQLIYRAAAIICDLPIADVRGIDISSLLQMIQRDSSTRRLYIIIHNIEGPGFSSSEAQNVISALADCERVHLVASCDDVNTPLLWDSQLRTRYNWLYHDVTTYAPYAVELITGSVPSLLTNRNVDRIEAGAAIVLRAMVPKARDVFRIIAEEQNGELGGVEFDRLLRLCRQNFTVSVAANLKAHLAEFRDHQLVQTKRGEDGVELLFVPLPPKALQAVLDEMMTGA